jgi:NAD(P)-dependent dehydrogenase (short-subunit alcohol dehydrogenase family)
MNKRTHAIVVGGTRGIGRVIARRLLEDGHAVSALGAHGQPGPKFAVEGVQYRAVDILDWAATAPALDELMGLQGKWGILVFCQRFRGAGDPWSGEIDTTLAATQRIIDHLAGRFDGSVAGSIVALTSVASEFVAEEQPLSYHVGKGGLDQLIRYYAVALGGKGIRVNGVAPGLVLKEETKEFILKDADLCERYRRFTPLKRLGTSEDIAGVVSFLCGPDSAFLTGQVLTVDGGLSLLTHESLVRRGLRPG